jgi:hypothetical protein
MGRYPGLDLTRGLGQCSRSASAGSSAPWEHCPGLLRPRDAGLPQDPVGYSASRACGQPILNTSLNRTPHLGVQSSALLSLFKRSSGFLQVLVSGEAVPVRCDQALVSSPPSPGA